MHSRLQTYGDPDMKEQRARQILQALIQGVDPKSGEELPSGTIIQQADVLRALLIGVAALEQTTARAHRRALLPGNVGRSWTGDEESTLIKSFEAGEDLSEIADKHGRTLRAIEARLEKLGMLATAERSTSNSFLTAATRSATKASKADDASGADGTAGDAEAESNGGNTDTEDAGDAEPP
jgi:hypothetical protein